MTKVDKKAAFTIAFELYYTKCMQFAMSYTHDKQLSEDLVSEAMETFWGELCKDREIQLPLPFLIGILRHKIMQYFRTQAAHARLDDIVREAGEAELALRMRSLKECDPYQLYFSEVQEILDRSLAEMSEQTRTIFGMSRFHRMTNREIAERLGMGIKGVEYHMSRALRKLRNDLKDYHIIIGFAAINMLLC